MMQEVVCFVERVTRYYRYMYRLSSYIWHIFICIAYFFGSERLSRLGIRVSNSSINLLIRGVILMKCEV